ncbi:hypothetical protein QYF36_009153 [Acer negundo]|nr:hypothetical protein QYF36_009153 [Acer negundo]
MNHCIYKSLISLSFNNSTQLSKPPFVYSISLLFLSSSSSRSHKTGTKTKVSLQDYLLNQHHFSPEAASKASSIRSHLKEPQNSDSVLSFLKQIGFSNTHLENLIQKAPTVLFADLDNTIKPKIKIFQDLGFSSTDIADLISTIPWIFKRSADGLEQSTLVLRSILGSNADVSKLLKASAWFLKSDLEKTMMPNIEFTKSCGITISQIVQHMFTFPRLFLHQPESMKDFVRRVDELGVDRTSKRFLPAIRTISSMTKENWERKLRLFGSLGFSEDDTLSVFRRMPPALAVSARKIKEVIEVLHRRANVDTSFIVNHPSVLLSSVENSLKPRLEIFNQLKSKNLLRRKTSLATICKLPKMKFIKRYVVPYSVELGEVSFPLRARSS